MTSEAATIENHLQARADACLDEQLTVLGRKL